MLKYQIEVCVLKAMKFKCQISNWAKFKSKPTLGSKIMFIHKFMHSP